MWIKALRLKEVGKFAAGHAIESFTPGLNVLVGANEHGKSTLLRALRVLFEYPHTSNHAHVRGLRPYSGGAPLIECEFVLADKVWTLKRQYLSARSAELRSFDGRELHRGGDVDDALAELLQSAAGSPVTLKSQWVTQGDGFRPPRAAVETVTTIQQLLAEEVSVATGGDQLDAVARDVHDQLALLVTAKSRKPKTGGPLHEAQRELHEVSQLLDDLRQKEEISAKRRARFDEIAGIVDDPATAHETERMREDIVARRQSIEAAQARLAQCELAMERRKRQAMELEMAEAALARFLGLIRTSDERKERLKEILRLLDDLCLANEGMQQRAALLSAELTKIQEKQELHRRRELKREQQRRLAELHERADELRQRLEALRELQDRLSGLDQQLKRGSVEAETRERAVTLQQEIERLGIQLKAQSATLVAEYSSDRHATFLVDGEELAGHAPISIDSSVVVEAPGIGTLRITPGRSEEIDRLRRHYDDKQASLADLLAEHSFESVDKLDQLWRETQQLGVERRHLLDQVNQLAPNGPDNLAKSLSQLEQQANELKVDGPDDCEPEAEQSSDNLAYRIEQLSRELKSVQYEIVKGHEQEGQLKHEQQQLEEQAARVTEREISEPDARNHKTTALREAVRLADESLNLVVRQEQALLDGAPSSEDVAESVKSLEEQERVLQQREDRFAVLREEANVLDGALKRDDEDGLSVQLQETLDQHAAVQARVDELQREVAALELLQQELAVIAGDRRRLITEPVVRRLAKIGRPLLGEVSFSLGDDLELSTIGRHGLDEAVAEISDGTREQVSVLSRLAFAELLSDGGHPLPLILDDPLVYSDDQRLADLFLILQQQAKKHQIIVLTCHENSFASLISDFGADQARIGHWHE